MHDRSIRWAFTLVELLVVVSIIAVLAAMLTPALESAVEQARRASCAANQHAIGIGSTDYVLQNRGDYIICRQRYVPFYFTPGSANKGGFSEPQDSTVDWVAALASVGLFKPTKGRLVSPFNSEDVITDHAPSEVWTCPSVRIGPTYQGKDHMWINFQYFGGIPRWRNRWTADFESRSPIKHSTSQGDWVLAADINFISRETAATSNRWWGNSNDSPVGIPPHRSGNPWPDGGNHLYVDGSVNWVAFEEMVYIHCWTKDHALFFAQKDLGGWNPPDAARGTAFMKATK